MTAIYDADQAARATPDIDWNVVGVTDEARRAQTKTLLAEGRLRTGADYEHAAFVFQHGDATADYLLAHTLSLVAIEKGRSQAVWIATATLDRYLMAIGQKQIYGTQFQMPYDKDKPTTQEPYDRAVVPDSLRDVLKVPRLAAQEERRAQMEAQRLEMLKHRVRRGVTPTAGAVAP